MHRAPWCGGRAGRGEAEPGGADQGAEELPHREVACVEIMVGFSLWMTGWSGQVPLSSVF